MSRGLGQEGGTGYIVKQFRSGGVSQRKAQDWTEVEEAGRDHKAQEMRSEGKDLQSQTVRDKKKKRSPKSVK